jgi:acetyltransferase-like isoleucine patch superfamily enzyme
MNKLKNFIVQKQKDNKKFQKRLSTIYYFLKKNKKKIRGKNNIVVHDGAFLAHVQIIIKGDNNKVIIEPGTKIFNTKIIMQGNNHYLRIGENCIMKKGVLWFEDYACEININNRTTIEEAYMSAVEPGSKIIIGEDCMFSSGIDIRNSDSHSIIDLKTKKRINPAKDIVIGNHVWVGYNAQILKGTEIGDNCIVGSRSLVSKSFPNNCIIAGVPASIVREHVDWTRERIYD